MNEEQLTSTRPEQRTEMGFHNLFNLDGKGVSITYGILRAKGEFFEYRDEQRELTFRTDRGEIDSIESQIGKQLTVTLENIPDGHALTLTLLLPTINPPGGEENPFSTLAIRTKIRSSIAGPELVNGPVQTYDVLLLKGVASQVD